MSGLEKWGLDPAKVPAAVQASSEPIVRLFAWHDAHPIAMTMVLMEKFGHQWIIWEGDTLKTEIIRTFNATSISENNWNKLQAVRALLSSVSYWSEWPVFEKVIQSLNNNIPDFEEAQRCTLAQLMAGVDMVSQLRSETYHEEVRYYVASCAVYEGVTYLPPPLDFAQRELSVPSYVCNDCGNVDPIDVEDGRCDFCVGRYQDQHNLNHEPAPWVPSHVGRNIEEFLKRDPSAARQAFEMMKGKDFYPVNDESPGEVQGAKLAVAYKYMKLRREQLSEQLKELKPWVTH